MWESPCNVIEVKCCLLCIVVCSCVVIEHSNRYGFQGKPMLDLSAKPKLGQREVTIHYVTEWIENKLKELLEVSEAIIFNIVKETGIFVFIEADGAAKHGKHCHTHLKFWHTRRCAI